MDSHVKNWLPVEPFIFIDNGVLKSSFWNRYFSHKFGCWVVFICLFNELVDNISASAQEGDFVVNVAFPKQMVCLRLYLGFVDAAINKLSNNLKQVKYVLSTLSFLRNERTLSILQRLCLPASLERTGNQTNLG